MSWKSFLSKYKPLNKYEHEKVGYDVCDACHGNVGSGSESGPGARPMERDWAAAIRDLCVKQNVKFFFKQWGGPIKKRNGRLLDGRTWDEFPDVVRADAERSFWR